MRILHINKTASGGGAAGICLVLHKALLSEGQESAVLVGFQTKELSGVGLISNDRYRSLWGRFWMTVAKWLSLNAGRIRRGRRLPDLWLPRLASPVRFWSWRTGQEDFDFPGTRHLLEQAPFQPDVLHLHNLHGDYFDLRELPRLSQAVPTIITMHDAWLLSGHCAHSFDCDRWKTGCGSCPNLDIYPALHRDGTALNWNRKRDIYRHSRLWLVCPSQWLAQKVRQSTLMTGATMLRVIPNGVDTSIFKPGNTAAARHRLGWPQDEFIVMFAADYGRRNQWKDYPTMREAIRLASEKAVGKSIRFFAIGATAAPEQAGAATIEFLPYRDSMVECYQAADVYFHAAKADTFPTTILEALACGTTVVATSVGGIPEQIVHGQTGFLSPAGNVDSLVCHLLRLLQDPQLCKRLGEAAAKDAEKRFCLARAVDNYLALYEEFSQCETSREPLLAAVG
jgi:glycosyltransferase involved in cell wall biosynthesis